MLKNKSDSIWGINLNEFLPIQNKFLIQINPSLNRFKPDDQAESIQIDPT